MKLRQAPLPHFDDRPAGSLIDTLIIHSIFVPGAKNPCDPQICIEALNQHQVSAHYLIDCAGELWSLVPEDKRAWHAGASKMPFPDDQREQVNAFSIGIELTGTESVDFTNEQYQALCALTRDILGRHPLKNILGHEHIAPGRKSDPGPRFNWKTYQALLEKIGSLKSIRCWGCK